MIQKVLTKYGLSLHVALIGAAVLALPFYRPLACGLSLVWFSLIALEFLFLLPSVHSGENFADARSRVLHKLLWDPFVYIGAAVLLIAASQAMNTGGKLVYLTDADIWQISPPAVEGLPFSVEQPVACFVLILLIACFVSGLVLRAGINHSGKRLVLNTLAVICGMVGTYFVVRCFFTQDMMKAVAASGGSAAGACFGFWAVVGFGGYIDSYRHAMKARTRLLLMVFGTWGNLAAALFYLDAVWAAVTLLIMVLLLVYGFFVISRYADGIDVLKLAVFTFFFIGAMILLFVYLYPKNPIVAKADFLTSMDFEKTWSDWTAMRKVRTAAAVDIWQDHPWWGVGIQGFRHFVGLSIDSKSWAMLKADPSMVYNDYLQFLCEYGIVGAGLFLAVALALVIPIGYHCRVLFAKGSEEGMPNGKTAFGDLSPLVVAGLLAFALVTVEAWFGSPFSTPALFLSWVVLLSSLPAFLPAHGE